MASQIKDTMGNLYENFLTRDLTYVSAGALMITSICHVFIGKLIELAKLVTDKPIAFIIFLAVSYFFGLIIKEGICLLFGKKVFTYGDSELSESHKLELYSFILRECGIGGIRRVERTVYFIHVGISFAIGSFISIIIFLYQALFKHQSVDSFVYIILGIVCIFSFLEYRKKFKQHKEIVTYFSSLMEKSENRSTQLC